jgi:hypothetical protein
MRHGCGSTTTPIAAAVGLAMFDTPLRGTWTFNGHPDTITLLGHTFKLSTKWAAPRRFVVAQYREDVPHNSLHLMVKSDGTWSIDHTDDANPEQGLVLEHAVLDVVQTPVGALLLTAAVAAVSAGVSFLLTRR